MILFLRMQLSDEVREDIAQFIAAYEKDPVDLKSLGIQDVKSSDIINRMKNIYL